MTITIIGLGPGDPALLTRRAWDIISRRADIYVRTARHPDVGRIACVGDGAQFRSHLRAGAAVRRGVRAGR